MTIDEGVAKVAAEIDKRLAQQLHDHALWMIECGVDDPDLVEDVLAAERAQHPVWRLTTLEQIRGWLATEFS
jgi:hypothetical protein